MARILIAAASLVGCLYVAISPASAQIQTTDAVGALRPRAVGAGNKPNAVDVTTTNSLAPEFIRAVADIGQPAEITLAKGETVRGLIEARCGLVTPAYLEAFLEKNREAAPSAMDLEHPSPGARYTFPFCMAPSTTRTPVTSSIEEIYSAQSLSLDSRSLEASRGGQAVEGRPLETLRAFQNDAQAGSNRGFLSTELARKFLKDNPGVQPRSIQEGARVTAVGIEATATVPLKLGVTGAAAQTTLSEAGTSATINQAKTASLIGDEVLRPHECDGVVAGEWPFRNDQLATALRKFETLATRKLVEPSSVKVMTLDTGYDPAFGLPAFDETSFGYLRGAGAEDQMDRIGLNATNSSDAYPPDDLGARQHGGEVAATILGGTYLPRVAPFLSKPRVAFVSIAALDASGTPYLDIGAIGQAVLIAKRSEVKIINASVSAQDRPESFLKTIADDTERLIVAAAGNSRSEQEFDGDNDPWPGSMGGAADNASSGVVVSVGGHDPTGRVLPFSRYGPEVDLLAPGCLIPTYTLSDGKVTSAERNGTSFAAPLVSLVAAQLARAGMTPRQIKDRLIVSADVSESVQDKSYSGGILDAERALSIWEDVVVYDQLNADGSTTRKTVSGMLDSKFGSISICGRNFEHRVLRKLELSEAAAPGRPNMWRGWVRKKNLERIEACAQSDTAVDGDPLSVQISGTNQKQLIPVASIRSFTARL